MPLHPDPHEHQNSIFRSALLLITVPSPSPLNETAARLLWSLFNLAEVGAVDAFAACVASAVLRGASRRLDCFLVRRKQFSLSLSSCVNSFVAHRSNPLCSATHSAGPSRSGDPQVMDLDLAKLPSRMPLPLREKWLNMVNAYKLNYRPYFVIFMLLDLFSSMTTWLRDDGILSKEEPATFLLTFPEAETGFMAVACLRRLEDFSYGYGDRHNHHKHVEETSFRDATEYLIVGFMIKSFYCLIILIHNPVSLRGGIKAYWRMENKVISEMLNLSGTTNLTIRFVLIFGKEVEGVIARAEKLCPSSTTTIPTLTASPPLAINLPRNRAEFTLLTASYNHFWYYTKNNQSIPPDQYSHRLTPLERTRLQTAWSSIRELWIFADSLSSFRTGRKAVWVLS